MPTDVYLIGTDRSVRVSDEYEQVTKQLNGREAAEFRLETTDGTVTIYKNAIAFVTNAQAGDVFVAAG